MRREYVRKAHDKAPVFGFQDTREDAVRGPKGEVFITLADATTGEVQDEHHLNIVTLDLSMLIARLLVNNLEPPHGLWALAVGTGQMGWNPLSPPAATNTQRSLWSEIARKTFASTNFVDSTGVPTSIPTNVFDLTTTFQASEAVGPLVEMGLLGGNINSNLSIRNPVLPPNGPYNASVNLTQYDTLSNYLSFPVISKPPTSTLTITWRITC